MFIIGFRHNTLLNDFFNTSLTLDVCYNDRPRKAADSDMQAEKTGAVDIREHPFVQETLRIFNARIARVIPDAEKNRKAGQKKSADMKI